MNGSEQTLLGKLPREGDETHNALPSTEPPTVNWSMLAFSFRVARTLHKRSAAIFVQFEKYTTLLSKDGLELRRETMADIETTIASSTFSQYNFSLLTQRGGEGIPLRESR